jgi:hypothetical protein
MRRVPDVAQCPLLLTCPRFGVWGLAIFLYGDCLGLAFGEFSVWGFFTVCGEFPMLPSVRFYSRVWGSRFEFWRLGIGAVCGEFLMLPSCPVSASAHAFGAWDLAFGDWGLRSGLEGLGLRGSG